MEIRDRSQDNNHGASWMSRLGDGRADRYIHRATEGKRLTHVSQTYAFSSSPLLSTEAGLVGFPGCRCLLLLKYRFALSEIKRAFVLMSKNIFMCVLDQAFDLVNRAAWTA